jgi:hypothetical protein
MFKIPSSQAILQIKSFCQSLYLVDKTLSKVAAGAETLEYFVKIWSLGKVWKCLNLQIGGLMVAHDDVHILLVKELCVSV